MSQCFICGDNATFIKEEDGHYMCRKCIHDWRDLDYMCPQCIHDGEELE